MSSDLLNLNQPRFNFRTNRKRSPIVGDTSCLRNKKSLFQILDSDASDTAFSSWFLDRYQGILSKRSTRLQVRKQRQLARHTKRLRYLLLLNTQNKPVGITRPKQKKPQSSGKPNS